MLRPPATGVQMPGSDVNKEFYWENQRQSLAAGTLQGYQELNAGGGAASVGANFEKLAPCALRAAGASVAGGGG